MQQNNRIDLSHSQVEFIDLLLTGNRKKAIEHISNLIKEKNSIDDIYFNYITPVMYEVGNRWANNEISVAQEHMATAIIEGLMARVFGDFDIMNNIGKNIVFACVEEEHHHLGLKMICDYFEFYGWDATFVGSNTPTGELIRQLQEKEYELLGLSVSLFFNLQYLNDSLKKITDELPNQKIIIGGQGLKSGGNAQIYGHKNIEVLTELKDLQKFAAP